MIFNRYNKDSGVSNINYQNLCLYCMDEKIVDKTCAKCSYEGEYVSESLLHLPPGTLLRDKFLLGRVLGQGGFGITYIAWDKTLNIKLAIKEYLPQQLATRLAGQNTVTVYKSSLAEEFNYGLNKFLEEARTLARFAENPNIVTVRDYFEANGTAYMVMNYVEGLTFEQYLFSKGGRISFKQALEIIMPVLDVLKEVHKVGIMHRDISPDNILLDNNGRVVLIDFGAARQDLKDRSKSLSVILKAGYAPLEQYSSKGEQGPWSDLYSVAATIYRAITGLMPPESIDRIVNDTLIVPTQAGAAIETGEEKALLKALALKVKNRYHSVEELQNDLWARKEITEKDSNLKPTIINDTKEWHKSVSGKKQYNVLESNEDVRVGMKHETGSKFIILTVIGIVAGLSLFFVNQMMGEQRDSSIKIDTTGHEAETLVVADDVESRGNSVGNIANVGIAVQQGDWIYHRKNDLQGALYKTNINSGEQIKLNDDDSWNINVMGDWLYYSNSAEKWNVYKMLIDGSDRTRVNSDDSGNLNVVGNWVYYRNDDEEGSIYKIRTDGTERTRLNNEQSYYLNVVDGWIYFQNRSDGGSLYKIRVDGTERTKLNNDDSWHLNVVDGWVYYCAANEGWQIFKVRLDGSERTFVNHDQSANLNSHDGWLYYRNDDDGSRLYKIRPDGSERELINNDQTYYFSITDGWVYYQNRSDDKKIYKMRLDGSGREQVN
jgi:serine/threonine protein kinase